MIKMVTVLRRINSDWNTDEIARLAKGLGVDIAVDFRHRSRLIIRGFVLESSVARIFPDLPGIDTQHIDGTRNPRLPFQLHFRR